MLRRCRCHAETFWFARACTAHKLSAAIGSVAAVESTPEWWLSSLSVRGGGCRRRIVGGRRRKADWLTMRLVLLLAVCATGPRDLATLHSRAQVLLAVAIVAGGRRCCGEGWPCSRLGRFAFHTRPSTPMTSCSALSTHAMSLKGCWPPLVPLLHERRWHGCQRW